MGCDTKGTLHKSVTVLEIKQVIVDNYDPNTIIRTSYDEFSYVITFKNGLENRGVHIYIGKNSSEDHEVAVHLSLGWWGDSVKIMKTILSYFGGWIHENDCGELPPYYVEKNQGLNNTEELQEVNRIHSTLSKRFAFDEIQKIIVNKDLILEAFGIKVD